MFKPPDELRERAGLPEGFEKRFRPLLLLPVLLLFNPLLALLLFLLLLFAPRTYAWWLARGRHSRIRSELPLYTGALRWLLESRPVPEALSSLEFGEVSALMKEACGAYRKGRPLESALSFQFDELNELARRLLVIHRTGRGLELLELYADRLAAEELARMKERSARMQLFSVAYMAFAALLPAMASGFSLSLPVKAPIYLSLVGSSALVMLWKLLA